MCAVNVAEAGEGSMEISVTSASGRNLPHDVQSVSSGMYEVSFTPTESGNHRANVLFNGEHVPGMPALSCAPQRSEREQLSTGSLVAKVGRQQNWKK